MKILLAFMLSVMISSCTPCDDGEVTGSDINSGGTRGTKNGQELLSYTKESRPIASSGKLQY